MKKIFTVGLIVLLLNFLFFNFAEAYVRVRGYSRKDGTYVMPHYRTYPNRYKWDNWSSRDNYNPFTGKKGYKRLYSW
ncbi:MAG: hypothetical protein KatS3mg097_560 [Candidatus Parcubacteria bacterium]|nr:MAG: hypothetical protein KatS3mg097_560 [Candidatus Parcubacteria bacterium]